MDHTSTPSADPSGEAAEEVDCNKDLRKTRKPLPLFSVKKDRIISAPRRPTISPGIFLRQ